jgi:hypothetical protein
MKITDQNFSHDKILNIKPLHAFEWIKTGHWTRQDFEKWLVIKMADQVKMAYILGLKKNFKESDVLSKDVN